MGADVHNVGDVAYGLQGLGEDNAVVSIVGRAELGPFDDLQCRWRLHRRDLEGHGARRPRAHAR